MERLPLLPKVPTYTPYRHHSRPHLTTTVLKEASSMTTTSSAVGTAHMRDTPIVPRGTLGEEAEGGVSIQRHKGRLSGQDVCQNRHKMATLDSLGLQRLVPRSSVACVCACIHTRSPRGTADSIQIRFGSGADL